MNDFDEAMIWKFKDVQDNKAMWKFCQEDFKQIFVEKSGKSFYNSLLNELVFSTLAPLELDFYIDRLTSALPLIPTSNKGTEQLPASIYKLDSLTVSIVSGSLAITSHDIKALDIVKKVFVNKGKLPCEHRVKTIGETVFHTYIFKLSSKA